MCMWMWMNVHCTLAPKCRTLLCQHSIPLFFQYNSAHKWQGRPTCAVNYLFFCGSWTNPHVECTRFYACMLADSVRRNQNCQIWKCSAMLLLGCGGVCAGHEITGRDHDKDSRDGHLGVNAALMAAVISHPDSLSISVYCDGTVLMPALYRRRILIVPTTPKALQL